MQITDLIFLQNLVEPMFVFSDLVQKLLVQNTVNDDCVGEGGFFFLKDGNLPVLFHDSIIHVGYGSYIFQTQFTQEIFHGQSDTGHFFFLNFSVQNDDAGIPVKNFFELSAFRGKERKNDLQRNDGENGNDGIQQWNRGIRQGIRGNV